MKNFSELGISKSLLQVLPELGFEKPSPIQDQSIPLLTEKPRDFIGLAQTGTGKTAAFGLPLLDWIDIGERTTQALILAPTRELGQQIAGQLEIFAKYLPNIQIQSVYGGASIVVQMKDIKRKTPQIVIATPGRLLDLMRRKVLDLSTIRFVVLDEADEMLNMGFKEDLDDVIGRSFESNGLIFLYRFRRPAGLDDRQKWAGEDPRRSLPCVALGKTHQPLDAICSLPW